MITKTRKQVAVIQTDTAKEFQDRMNEELSKRDKPNVVYLSIPFTAYVEYTETVEEPESLKEKYELANDSRECQECPYFKRTKDKRYKWHFCLQKQKAVTECQSACETYYQLLEELIKEGLEC